MIRPAVAVTAALALVLPTAAQAAEGDIIVRREPGLDRQESAELRKDAGVKLVAALPIEQTELVEPKHGDTAAALAALRADDDVVYAEPDRRVSATSAPSAFTWPELWALENDADADIDALAAWQRSLGAGITVAVVDSGVNATHVDLATQLANNPAEQLNGVDDDGNRLVDDVAGWDFIGDDDSPRDGNGHGTHVSGTIAANGDALIGVAPEAKVLPLRVLDDSGDGYMSDIASAFDYAGDLGVRVVNASLGGAAASSALSRAIAEHPNTLYVVAAGNSAADNDVAATASYPCALPAANILCVGATDSQDRRAWFSNYGATTVDLSAPGVDIESAWIGSDTVYATKSGTSMAAPHVAGAAALALAARPGATASQLKWALMSSVDAKDGLAGRSVTGGRLNADAAVAALTGDAVPTPEPTATATPEPTATPSAPIATPPVSTPAPVATPPAAVVVPPSRLTALGASATRGRLTVRFSLSRPAAVRFSLTRRGARKPLATWTSRGRVGANRVVVKRRALKAGRYTLKVTLGATSSSRALRVR